MGTETSLLDELSIIIVTWHGDDVLANCLSSLQTACGTRPEIVVVDNAGESSTRELVEPYANVKYLSTEKNLGFSGGNNRGLVACTRKYILLLNNDTVVHQEPFSHLIQFLKDHSKVAVVQGRMNLPLCGDVLDACGIQLAATGLLVERYAHVARKDVPNSYVLAAKGACLLFDRKVLDDLDGVLFHDHFFNNHEETDFCHRVWLMGWRVMYVDTPPIDHLCNFTVKRLNQVEFAGQNLSNHIFSFLTLFGTRGLLTVMPFFVVLQLVIAIRFLVVGNADPARGMVIALRRLWARRNLLVQTRKQIQSARVVSDSELFKMVVPPRSFRYSWLWIRGLSSRYWNDCQ